jgi:hypothetical protein
MTLPRTYLLPSDVQVVKERLWKGEETQEEIATAFYTTQATVSRIYRGYQWPDVPWPNGDAGAMPASRVGEIFEARRTGVPIPGQTAVAGHSALAETVAAKVVAERKERSDKALKSAGKAPPTQKVRKRKTAATAWDTIPWKDVVTQAPENRLVKRGEKDEALKQAICTIFAGLPVSQWDTEPVEVLVEGMYKRITS